MRFLVLIPMFALLLSNIPIKVELTIVEENMPVCSMSSADMQCDMMMKRKLCCQSKESTCVIYSCFQFTAPAVNITKFVFISPEQELLYTAYQHPFWNNPFISGPLQPPDMV